MERHTVFAHRNYKAMYEVACKTIKATVDELMKTRAENEKLRKDAEEFKKQFVANAEALRAIIVKRDDEIDNLRAELKVRCGEVATISELADRQREELKRRDEIIAAARGILQGK